MRRFTVRVNMDGGVSAQECADGGLVPFEDVQPIIAERDALAETARQASDGMTYYRGLLDTIGKSIGRDAYVADDGSVSDDVLRAKVPELVSAIIAGRDQLVEQLSLSDSHLVRVVAERDQLRAELQKERDAAKGRELLKQDLVRWSAENERLRGERDALVGMARRLVEGKEQLQARAKELEAWARLVVRRWDENGSRLSEGNPTRAELVDESVEGLRLALEVDTK